MYDSSRLNPQNYPCKYCGKPSNGSVGKINDPTYIEYVCEYCYHNVLHMKPLREIVDNNIRNNKMKELVNHIALILDDSGSMKHIASQAQKVFNTWLDKIKNEAKTSNQLSLISMIKFGVNANIEFKHEPYTKVEQITSYIPRQGATALCDGVVLGVNTLEENNETFKHCDNSYLVIVATDGQENNSSYTNIKQLPNIITEHQGRDNWTFVFLVPPGAKNSFGYTYKIPLGNISEWDSDAQSITNMESQTSIGITNYYTSRSIGTRSISNFFETDLSKVTSSKIKHDLTDISKDCHIYTVEKESQIKKFVEGHGKTYKKGCAYYQLMKPEKIQSYKQVCIYDKKTKKIWGGGNARTLIGAPVGVDSKVTPGNHANYEIFIQSTSVNRILPRGTKLLVNIL